MPASNFKVRSLFSRHKFAFNKFVFCRNTAVVGLIQGWSININIYISKHNIVLKNSQVYFEAQIKNLGKNWILFESIWVVYFSISHHWYRNWGSSHWNSLSYCLQKEDSEFTPYSIHVLFQLMGLRGFPASQVSFTPRMVSRYDNNCESYGKDNIGTIWYMHPLERS